MQTDVPSQSLLGELQAARGAFADAYTLNVSGSVTLAAFVQAFYATPLFKLERWLLARFGYPSRDADAAALVRGDAQRFAAWTLHARREHELVMMDAHEVTCSWFQVAPEGEGTRLWFGSAVFPRRRHADGSPRFGLLFGLLLGFHVAYSKALLRAAAARLRKGAR